MTQEFDTKDNYKVVFFPGSITEYERFRGYEVEVVDMGVQDKGIFTIGDQRDKVYRIFGSDSLDYLFNDCAIIKSEFPFEALVNVQFLQLTERNGRLSQRYYGLPVRRKPDKHLKK